MDREKLYNKCLKEIDDIPDEQMIIVGGYKINYKDYAKYCLDNIWNDFQDKPDDIFESYMISFMP